MDDLRDGVVAVAGKAAGASDIRAERLREQRNGYQWQCRQRLAHPL